MHQSVWDENQSQFDFCNNLKVYLGSKKELEGITGFQLHHGVIARAKRPKYQSLDELGTRILVLNGLNKAENIGTIMRTCDALGIDSVIIDQNTLSPYYRRAIRVSMGSVFRLKIHESQNLETTLGDLSKRGFQVVGSALRDDAITPEEMNWSGKIALVIGSEGSEWKKGYNHCNCILKFPFTQPSTALMHPSQQGYFSIICVSYRFEPDKTL